jgi:hypothetical protein
MLDQTFLTGASVPSPPENDYSGNPAADACSVNASLMPQAEFKRPKYGPVTNRIVAA